MTSAQPGLPDSRSLVDRNGDTYDSILAVALGDADAHPDLAAAWAEMAADFAWKCHPGFFVDERMEQLLAQIGRAIPHRRENRHRAKSPESVLHVLTEGYAIGGHTRLAWRWIEMDRSRRHSVVLTRQGTSFPVPEKLSAAATAAGGFIRALDWQQFLPLARAEQLRGFAADFDMVVVHAHPFDVVPAMAFAGSGGPPVVLLNHASYAFWVGRDAADIVVCLRPSSRDVAINRRGLDPGRCPLLPIPVDQPAHGASSIEARIALGVPQDAVVLLTVAAPYKYLPFEPGPSLLPLIVTVALTHDRVHVIAVGPADEGAWHEAGERTGGRIRALGPDADVDLAARATDVYLDSFPVTSPTSFLEVGRYGAPIVSLNSYRHQAPVLCPDDARAENLFVRVSADSFATTVGRLVEDAPRRAALGRVTADAVLAGHGPEAFTNSLERVYAAAISACENGRLVAGGVGDRGPLDECLVRMQQVAGHSVPLHQITDLHLDAFPLEFQQLARELSIELEADADVSTGTGP